MERETKKVNSGVKGGREEESSGCRGGGSKRQVGMRFVRSSEPQDGGA